MQQIKSGAQNQPLVKYILFLIVQVKNTSYASLYLSIKV